MKDLGDGGTSGVQPAYGLRPPVLLFLLPGNTQTSPIARQNSAWVRPEEFVPLHDITQQTGENFLFPCLPSPGLMTHSSLNLCGTWPGAGHPAGQAHVC